MGRSRAHSDFCFCLDGVEYHVYSVCIYTLLKVVGYYELSVLSMMSVMSFQKKVWMGGGGWGDLYPSFLDFFNFAKPLSRQHIGYGIYCSWLQE